MPLEAAEVVQYYQAILQREPSEDELSAASAAHDDGGELIQALVSSDEAHDFVFPILQIYEASFGRVPDAAGLDFWVDAYRSGTSLEVIADGFAQSQEFRSLYGEDAPGNDPAFLQAIYLNTLARPGDPAGIEFWRAQDDLSQADIVRLFSQGDEFTSRNIEANADFLTALANGEPYDWGLVACYIDTDAELIGVSSPDIDYL